MAGGQVRETLVDRINTAFALDEIDNTARRLAHLSAYWHDVFDILAALGFLDYLPPGYDYNRYRERVGIPELHQRQLTDAFWTAIRERMPLSILIHDGMGEAVSFMTASHSIAIVLTRDPKNDKTMKPKIVAEPLPWG